MQKVPAGLQLLFQQRGRDSQSTLRNCLRPIFPRGHIPAPPVLPPANAALRRAVALKPAAWSGPRSHEGGSRIGCASCSLRDGPAGRLGAGASPARLTADHGAGSAPLAANVRPAMQQRCPNAAKLSTGMSPLHISPCRRLRRTRWRPSARASPPAGTRTSPPRRPTAPPPTLSATAQATAGSTPPALAMGRTPPATPSPTCGTTLPRPTRCPARWAPSTATAPRCT